MSDHQKGEPADILLVEDDPGDVRLTKEAFKDGQIANSLHVVTDGTEALEFLYRRGEYSNAPRPDIVLLGLNIQQKDGGEVLEEIEGDPELQSIPVIVLTSSETTKNMIESSDLSATAHLTKPVDPGAFLETVRSLNEFRISLVRLAERDE